MILLQRIADEEFRLLLDEAPCEMNAVATLCEQRYRRATMGMERPVRTWERVRLRRQLVDAAVEACKERGLLRDVCNRLDFAWETILVSVVLWIIKQLIEEWF